MAKLCLVDGSGYIFRAFHALPSLNTPSGIPVNAVYGFTRAMMALQEKGNVDYLAVIFDSSRISFRQDIYKEYKAQRPDTPEELIPQFALMREAVQALNIAAIEREGFEADDIIASYAKIAKDNNIEVEILSSDKDLMQLVDDTNKIYMYDPIKKKYIYEEQVFEKFGVTPQQVVHVQALMGDSSDNVPGVKGIGPKGAALLINQFDTLENVYANLESIDKKNVKLKLEDNKELALLSLELVKLKKDIENLPAISELNFKQPISTTLYEFLNKLSFTSMALKVAKDANLDLKELSAISHEKLSIHGNKQYDGSRNNILQNSALHNNNSQDDLIAQAPEGEDIASNNDNTGIVVNKIYNKVEVNQTIEICTHVQLQQFYKEALEPLKGMEEIAIFWQDRFKDKESKKEVKPHLAIFVAPLKTNYKIFFKDDNDDNLFEDLSEVIILKDFLLQLKVIFEATHIRKIFYDVKAFYKVLKSLDINLQSYEDLLLISYLLHGSSSKSSLSYLAINEYLIVEGELASAVELLNLYYLYDDALISIKSKYAYECLDKPLISLLAQMEEVGILVDKEILNQLSLQYSQTIAKLQQEIFAITKEEFNLASPKQIGEFLFEKMQIQGKKNKSGSWKTSATFLEDLAEDGVEVANLILQWRQISKLKNTYSDSLQQKINPITKRIHTTFLITHTSTGRLSSIEPNLQNIPIKTRDGKNIRRAFVSAKGYKIISLDYSQIELRVLAIIADIKSLHDSFANKEDIHNRTAAEIFNIPLNEVTSDYRRRAKAINFGIIYGQTQHGLSSLLGISKEEAQNYIDSYFEKYPEIKKYMDDTMAFAAKNGYVPTMFGRRCIVKDINSKNYTLKSLAQRMAINARIQGSAADIMKLAMIKASKVILENNYDAKILLQVHDEIVIEVKEDQSLVVAEKLQQAMINVCELELPLDVNYAIGDNWLDAH